MEPDRIVSLLAPYIGPARQLTATQTQQISTYLDLLLRWNTRINLTAIRDPEHIVTRHFGESLFAAHHLFPQGCAAANAPIRLADVGSGAGFPGLPMKLWRPELSLTLIESNHKKAAFLGEAVRALGLTDVHIATTRAEAVPPGTFLVVTLRAVDRMATVVPVAANLVIPEGRLVLFLTAAQVEPIRRTMPDLAWNPPTPIPQSESRVLLIGKKEPDK